MDYDSSIRLSQFLQYLRTKEQAQKEGLSIEEVEKLEGIMNFDN